MNRSIILIALIFVVGMLLFISPGMTASGNMQANMSAAQPHPSQLQVTSHIPGKNQELFLPSNNSNIQMYPDWNISIYASQSFSITVNGKILNSGSGPIEIHENMSLYKTVNMNITIGTTTYHYSNIQIIGLPPQIAIYSVSAISHYTGQSQYLTAHPGQSGTLMYPIWEITMLASNNVSYSIRDNGLKIASGHILGKKTIEFNVSGNTTSVTVSLGSHIYNFNNELIARVPLQKYYAPPAPPLIYSLAQYERGLIVAAISSFMSFGIGIVIIGKYVREKEATQASMIWRP